MPQILPPKKDVALALLERASVFVHLDPRGDALVPVNFKKQPRLVLQIGLNMAVPIPDLRLDDHGMSCTLSFNRAKFHCVVPWPSVFALVGEDGRGMVWPDDVPREIAGEMGPRADSPSVPATPGAPSSPAERGLAIAPNPERDRERAERAERAAAKSDRPDRPERMGPAIVAKKKPHVSLVGAGASKSPKKRAGSRKQDKPSLVSVPKSKPTPPVALPPIDLAAEKAEKADRAERAEKAARTQREDRNSSNAPSAPSAPAASPSSSSLANAVHGTNAAGASSNAAGAGGASGKKEDSSSPFPSPTPPKKSAKRELPPYLRVVK